MEQHLEDYLFVSTYLGYERRWDRESLMPFASALAGLRGWDEDRVSAEVDAIVGGAELTHGGVHFRVWAPRRRSVEVVIGGARERVVPLQPDGSGYYSALVEGI